MRKLILLAAVFFFTAWCSFAFSATTVFDVNFNDNATPAGWQNGGTAIWDFNSGYGKTTIANNDGGWWSTPISADSNEITLSIRSAANTSGTMYGWIGDANGGAGFNSQYPSGNGYALNVRNGGAGDTISLARYTSSTKTILVNSDTWVAGTAYYLRADRNASLGWTFYVNGAVIGYAQETSTTFSHFTFAQFYGNNGNAAPRTNMIDDFNLVNNAAVSPPATQVYRVTWDVNLAGTATALSGVTADWNVNEYDVSGQNSPFGQDANAGNYSVTFSKAGLDNNVMFLNLDSNKTVEVFLTDSTAPSVGVTTLSGFTTSGAYIKGTGTIIGGTATDAGSGINTATCEYTANNGGAWAAATWNSDHCDKINYTITDGESFQANTRVSDQNSNTGVGTATAAYTGDTVGATTTMSGCGSDWNKNDQNITLSCSDSGAGCKTTFYRIDSGSWATGTSFTISTDGNHAITFLSSDNLDTNGATVTNYCAVDKTAPSVGVTTVTGFTIYGIYINGTGDIIGGEVTDATSGVNTATCEYSPDNSSWGAAVWDTNHCKKTGLVAQDSNLYFFNTRASDIAGNLGTGSSTFLTGDVNAPFTGVSGCPAGINVMPPTLTLSCNDANGAGCANTQYRFNGGAWQNYAAPFVLSIDGNTKIDYNSTDNVSNVETTKTTYCYYAAQPDANFSLVRARYYDANILATVDSNMTCRYAATNTDYNHMGGDTNITYPSGYIQVTGLTQNTALTYYFGCRDGANQDSNVKSVSFTTALYPDYNVSTSTAQQNTTLSLTSNKDLNCGYALTDINYENIGNRFDLNTSYSFVFSNLLKDVLYRWYFSCQDSLGTDVNKNVSVFNGMGFASTGGGGGQIYADQNVRLATQEDLNNLTVLEVVASNSKNPSGEVYSLAIMSFIGILCVYVYGSLWIKKFSWWYFITLLVALPLLISFFLYLYFGVSGIEGLLDFIQQRLGFITQAAFQ